MVDATESCQFTRNAARISSFPLIFLLASEAGCNNNESIAPKCHERSILRCFQGAYQRCQVSQIALACKYLGVWLPLCETLNLNGAAGGAQLLSI